VGRPTEYRSFKVDIVDGGRKECDGRSASVGGEGDEGLVHSQRDAPLCTVRSGRSGKYNLLSIE